MSGKRKKMAQNENEQAQTRQAQKKDEVPEKKEQIEYLLYIYRQKQQGRVFTYLALFVFISSI
ncbi:MAG: hypothetical protein MUO31_03515 [Thermodesulfovibrionales bacterium]|nr:hypothetical protein [Thermodesulfovibrionales bacterium]